MKRRRQQALRNTPELIVASTGELIAIAAAEGDAASKLPRFKMVAYTGGLMYPRGFYYPVVIDLVGLQIGKQTKPILRDHNTDRIVGNSDKVEIAGIRLLVEGDVSGIGDDAQEVLATAKNNFPWQSSVGARPLPGQLKFVDEGEKVTANGQVFTGPLYIARKSVLNEISFVVFGGDNKTSASVSALAQSGVDPMNFENWIRAQGFDPETINDHQRTSLQAMYDGQQTDDNDHPAGGGGNVNAQGNGQGTPPANPQVPPIDLQAIHQQTQQTAVDAIRQENVRISGINRICAQFQNPKFKVNGAEVELQAHAIEQGWDLQRTELEARRESRPSGPAIHSHSHDSSCTVESLQGSMMLRCGLALDNPHFQSIQAQSMELPNWVLAGLNNDNRQRTMEAAHRYSDMSLVDICAEAVRLDGRSTPRNRREMIEAAFSGSTLTKVFTTNVNAMVIATFMGIGDTTRGWCHENMNVSNFQPQDRNRLTKAGSLQKLPRGKTAQNAERSDTGESYRIARYAEQFSMDEQDIIDDMFGMLQDTPREMAEAAARLRPELVYAILIGNPVMADNTTLFHADRGNLTTGAALAEATLKAAITALGTRTENGVTLDLNPTHLVVPRKLKFTGDSLLDSSETRIAAGGPTKNTLQGAVTTLVSDGRLDNGVTDPDTGTVHAGSAVNWFLISADRPPIEVGYLRGSGGVPTVRSFVENKGKYGMGWDVKLDVGAKAIRWQSAQRCNG